jgi:hypothetical protein
MKALEFRARLTQDRTLKIPPGIAAQVPLQQSVRVILLVPEEAEDQDWAKLTAKQFSKGYAPSDAIYDDLSAG